MISHIQSWLNSFNWNKFKLRFELIMFSFQNAGFKITILQRFHWRVLSTWPKQCADWGCKRAKPWRNFSGVVSVLRGTWLNGIKDWNKFVYATNTPNFYAFKIKFQSSYVILSSDPFNMFQPFCCIPHTVNSQKANTTAAVMALFYTLEPTNLFSL